MNTLAFLTRTNVQLDDTPTQVHRVRHELSCRLLWLFGCVFLLTALPGTASAQCPGCEPDYVGAWDVGDRNAEYCFDASVPTDAQDAFEEAAGNWATETDVNYTEGACDFEVEYDPEETAGGRWCYAGSYCDSSGGQGGGHGVLVLGQLTRMVGIFAHEIAHTVGWDHVDCSYSVVYTYVGAEGPEGYDVCWYDYMFGESGGGGGPLPTRMSVGSSSVSPIGVLAGPKPIAGQGQRNRIMPAPPILYDDPVSFGSMVRRGQLVVLVRILAHEYVRIGRNLLTRYTAEVVEGFRNEGPQISSTVDFYQHGGVLETAEGTVDYRARGFRRLTDGGYALIVGRWHEPYQGYVFNYGPEGVFEFLLQDPGNLSAGGMVRTQGRAADIPLQSGKGIAQFLSDVRAAISR